jgi:hypothetical protein
MFSIDLKNSSVCFDAPAKLNTEPVVESVAAGVNREVVNVDGD